jgi:CheY-like chemotaxis protein
MDGEISVESQLGEGALFRVELPFEPVGEGEVRDAGGEESGRVIGLAAGQPAYRILIAEAQYDNQQLLARLMRDIGLAIKTADDGEQCVRMFREWQPDLIWMAPRMPVLDGIEASRCIRGLPGGERVKIVAIGATLSKAQQSEITAAGMDDLVDIPYRADEIYDCLALQLGLEFIHAMPSATRESGNNELTAEKMAVLPGDLRAEFKQVLECLDEQRIVESIRRAGDIDAELGKILAGLVGRFDYPQILAVLSKLETLDE